MCPDECSANDYIAMGGETSSCQCTPHCADDHESRAVRCCADVFFEQSMTDVDLTADLERGNCHFDPCVNNPDPSHPSCLIKTPHLHSSGENGWADSCPAAATGQQPGQGGGNINDPACNNGVRVCGAASSSTMGWNGEPDRAIDGKHCSEWDDGSCTHTDAGMKMMDPQTGMQREDINADGKTEHFLELLMLAHEEHFQNNQVLRMVLHGGKLTLVGLHPSRRSRCGTALAAATSSWTR